MDNYLNSWEYFDHMTALFRTLYKVSQKHEIEGLRDFLDDLEQRLDDFMKMSENGT